MFSDALLCCVVCGLCSSSQVLQAVVKCEAGVFLTDESICKAYQAAFMLGNLDAGEDEAHSCIGRLP